MTTRPKVLSIAPGKGFVDALAAGILDEIGEDVFRLADYRILLPTRRAVRALREAFLRLRGGQPMVLPAMLPIGDVDEEAFLFQESPFAKDALNLPPAISELRRRLLLSELLMHEGLLRKDGRDRPTPEQAATLAAELARFLDRVETERLSLDKLARLVPEDYAVHWQETLRFLQILTDYWPGILVQEGCIDPADRRNRLLEAQVKMWLASPPKGPVIAAGSTGSIPATADLLSLVACLPKGRLVLAGLDRSMDAESWQALNATHPQFGLKRLLEQLDLARDDVGDWSADVPETCAERAELASELMRPAETTHLWHRSERPWDKALQDVRRIECADPAEEAGVIALLLRQSLEEDGTRAALVTPDRNLARRVAAELRRWNIEVDDSGGTSLDTTAPGTFLRLTARLMAENISPVALMACFKHPLAAGGLSPADFRRRTRQLEVAALRGPRPAPGFSGLKEALKAPHRVGNGAERDALVAWVAGLEKMAGPFARAMAKTSVSLGELLDLHVAFSEALAMTDAMTESSAAGERLWATPAGEALAEFIADLRAAARGFPRLAGADYAALFESLLTGQVVRPYGGQHPRIHIWGPLEARLQQAELLILGGLNEGVWPPSSETDPWMSRPMREKFGLPLPERRIGLSAHDFAQGFSSPRVVLTRAARADGAPTVPSRWLLRLESLAGSDTADGVKNPLRWRALLQMPAKKIQIGAPKPCPPLAARPRKLSVTAIETWMRDPYAIYARHILRLRPLDPMDADPGAADRGRFIHAALDRFVRAYPDQLPKDAVEKLLKIGKDVFGEALSYPGVATFWWPRFVHIAAWFVDQERARRKEILLIHTETKGAWIFAGAGGDFTLTARADRIDHLRSGGLAVLDYKTGAVPKTKDVTAGVAPQLALEAILAGAGGFEGIPEETVRELLYLQLSGGALPGKRVLLKDTEILVAEARAGLQCLIAAFDDPATPYLSEPRPAMAPTYSDYKHLARVQEWTDMREEGDS
ncbi:MAG: double-strand break repair protein AddB [Rhodospirillaceae bacterium]|nr:MAG: double-strand break repair protein AddB [Rhodospirillaceae bacterium]